MLIKKGYLKKKQTALNITTATILRLMALQYNIRPTLKKALKSKDGWINFSVGFRTRTKTVEQTIIFKNGKVSVIGYIPENIDIVLDFINDETLKKLSRFTPNEVLDLIMTNQMTFDGNLIYLQIFNYYVSLIMGKKHQKTLEHSHCPCE